MKAVLIHPDVNERQSEVVADDGAIVSGVIDRPQDNACDHGHKSKIYTDLVFLKEAFRWKSIK